MRNLPRLLAALLLSVAATDTRAWCQEGPGNNPALMGEINIEAADRYTDPYAETQNRTIAFFENLLTHARALHSGNIKPVEDLDSNSINYLTGIYLYCTIQTGTCPLVLDAILEIDVINSKISKRTACPNLTRFWKQWVKNDMEQRQKFMIKTSQILETDKFTKTVRPKYIKCKDGVAAEMIGAGIDTAYFAERYAPDSPRIRILEKMAKLLPEIKQRVPNIFVAVGAK